MSGPDSLVRLYCHTNELSLSKLWAFGDKFASGDSISCTNVWCKGNKLFVIGDTTTLSTASSANSGKKFDTLVVTLLGVKISDIFGQRQIPDVELYSVYIGKCLLTAVGETF